MSKDAPTIGLGCKVTIGKGKEQWIVRGQENDEELRLVNKKGDIEVAEISNLTIVPPKKKAAPKKKK